MVFFRFYFASSNDLLDILSNGNQPLKVAKHLTKLFDSMAKLKLRLDTNKEVTNLAYAMIAKDGEVVDFDRDVHCENQVEVWLNRLMDIMRSTIRYENYPPYNSFIAGSGRFDCFCSSNVVSSLNYVLMSIINCPDLA